MADAPTMFCPACGAVRDADAARACPSCGATPSVVLRRLEPTSTATTPATDASPTGKPLIPPTVVPYVGALTGLALAVAGVAAFIPGGQPVASAAGALASVGLFLLGLSPGWRRPNGHGQ